MYNMFVHANIPTAQTDSNLYLHRSNFHVFEQLSNEITIYHYSILYYIHFSGTLV